MRANYLVVVALAAFVGCAPAGAESPRAALEQFGFTGTWALRCDEPASPTNVVRVVSTSPAGDPIFAETLGDPSAANSYVILQARVVGPDRLVLRTKLNGEVEQELTMQRRQDQVRTLSNRDVMTGKLIVVGGVVSSNGSETPWLSHCTDK